MMMIEVKTYLVEGMMCGNCISHVESGIRQLSGIENVIVDLSNGQVRVSGSRIADEEIRQAVEKSGYTYKGPVSGTPLNSEHWIS